MVVEDGLELKKVASKLHIKIPTAKFIVKRFEEDGKILNKQCPKRNTKVTSVTEVEPVMQEQAP